MAKHETVLNRLHRDFLLTHKEEWTESRKKMVEQYPFLNIVSHLPYPSEIRAWKEEMHLDGFIYLFDPKAAKAISELKHTPGELEEFVFGAEDDYYEDCFGEYPYFKGYGTLEQFLEEFAHDYRQLQNENRFLRQTLFANHLEVGQLYSDKYRVLWPVDEKAEGETAALNSDISSDSDFYIETTDSENEGGADEKQ